MAPELRPRPDPRRRRRLGSPHAGDGRAHRARLTAATRRISQLELLHPDGRTDRALVLGGGCPERLAPDASASGAADVVIVAPDEAERRDAEWRERSVRRVAEVLHGDGVAYVIAPIVWRRRWLAAARSAGLLVGPTFLHLPDGASSRWLVPATSAPAGYALSRLVPLRSWRGRGAATLVRAGGAALVAAASAAGTVARRPGARPLLEWLEAAGATAPAARTAVGRTWRPDARSAAAVVVDGAGRPELVAKLGYPPRSPRPGLGDARALVELGDGARAAGADVPRLVAATDLGGVPLVVQTGVDGRPASFALRQSPELLGTLLARVTTWLERWAAHTAREVVLEPRVLEREILEPARAVAPALQRGIEYVAELEARCAAVEGQRARLAAAHGDLTTENVLVRPGALGIVDWDTARETSLPLTDFFYAAVDAHAVARGTGRAAAFAGCFGGRGQIAGTIAELEAQAARPLRLDVRVRDLSFHACWLHHAANELGRPSSEAAGFVEIARRLAEATG